MFPKKSVCERERERQREREREEKKMTIKYWGLFLVIGKIVCERVREIPKKRLEKGKLKSALQRKRGEKKERRKEKSSHTLKVFHFSEKLLFLANKKIL
jgi:hypothetical protein